MAKIMKIPFSNAEEAVRDLRTVEREYLVVDHELAAGDGFPEDIHQSNEWIILHPGKGSCEIAMDICSEVVELLPTEALVIPISAGFAHYLKAITNLSYTVLRDGFK